MERQKKNGAEEIESKTKTNYKSSMAGKEVELNWRETEESKKNKRKGNKQCIQVKSFEV